VRSPAIQLALCTAPLAQADQLVRTLVEERLVACGNIVAVRSLYRWQGNLEADEEALIIFKTTETAWPHLKSRVPELHPYDVPELLLLNVADGLEPYLDWVTQSTNRDE
jgi:periplasmic divalent cation tolerance protein